MRDGRHDRARGVREEGHVLGAGGGGVVGREEQGRGGFGAAREDEGLRVDLVGDGSDPERAWVDGGSDVRVVEGMG